MKSFHNSDYAINKFSEGIVYRFADRIVVVTLDDYLAENPDKTEQDFQELKELSDAIYYRQDRDENAQTKKNDSIHGIEDTNDFGDVQLEEQYIERQEDEHATEAITLLLESGLLTDTQHRRFVLHIIDGLSLREIARHECVTFHAIAQSINAAVDKLRSIFNKF